ncbi:MAG: plastocyanin/azurin family copper-binding protein [Myxococcota bacterium]|nr:plastocyanin/azurin family copper-binding protein [Myxococcota bacterium]MEC9388984.1 plastocyanin/azurin family copper-binding protein [Myxococcota bacterium]
MKTYLALALLVPALALTACDDKADDTGDTAAEADADADADADSDADGTVHEVLTADGDMTFTPEDLTISVGDTVRFVMSPTHNAIEVSEDTYASRGTAALNGGFQVTFGQTDEVTFTEAGTHYYVCTPHVTIGMVGTITVE